MCSIRSTNTHLPNRFYKFVYLQLFNVRYDFVNLQLFNVNFWFSEKPFASKRERKNQKRRIERLFMDARLYFPILNSPGKMMAC